MNPVGETLEVMSTRLFPKNRGADGYAITGIAARCDWVVLSDSQAPRATLVKREEGSPRHVFLSFRAPFDALSFFLDQVLPQIVEPFVLVSGSEDITVPRQLDRRWRPFSTEEIIRINALLEDPRLVHWYAENLDDASHPKFSPIPLGMVFPASSGPQMRVPSVPPLGARPTSVLCAHRVRNGAQWDLRREVTRLCRDYFSGFCTVVEDEVPEHRFIELVHRHAFVICVAGGGLDPSPKAWQVLLHGAIPIIRSTPLDAAYARLPVALVEEWNASTLSRAKLGEWTSRYSPIHDIPEHRAVMLQRLGIDYWWTHICTKLQPASEAGEACRSERRAWP